MWPAFKSGPAYHPLKDDDGIELESPDSLEIDTQRYDINSKGRLVF
jgi:hypothetical protein